MANEKFATFLIWEFSYCYSLGHLRQQWAHDQRGDGVIFVQRASNRVLEKRILSQTVFGQLLDGQEAGGNYASVVDVDGPPGASVKRHV